MSSATGDYDLDAVQSTCMQGESLKPAGSCTIAVDFTPSIKTNTLSDIAHLQVRTNAKMINPRGGVVTLKGGGR